MLRVASSLIPRGQGPRPTTGSVGAREVRKRVVVAVLLVATAPHALLPASEIGEVTARWVADWLGHRAAVDQRLRSALEVAAQSNPERDAAFLAVVAWDLATGGERGAGGEGADVLLRALGDQAIRVSGHPVTPPESATLRVGSVDKWLPARFLKSAPTAEAAGPLHQIASLHIQSAEAPSRAAFEASEARPQGP